METLSESGEQEAMSKGKKPLYTLISLEDFKAVLSIDDRDDTLNGYCLMTASHSIEQYRKRRFLRKKYFEHIAFYSDLLLPLREYPVTEMLTAHVIPDYREPAQILEPDFYNVVPDCGRGPAGLARKLWFPPHLEFSTIESAVRGDQA